LASLSLATTLAGGFAITGCGGDNGTPQTTDGGMDSSNLPDVTPDRGQDVTMNDGGGMDAPADRGVDSPPDVMTMPETSMMDSPPPPDAGQACGLPTFNPNGGMVMAGSSVMIAGPSGFPTSGYIFYTTNGTLPNHNSLVITGGSGSVQINNNETINAIAFAQGSCTDSLPATATFTLTTPPPPDSGAPPSIPGFNPTTTKQTNDFLVSLSSSSGATICYTTDGNMPTCTNGTCGSGSQTYGGTGVSINGSITNSAGQVTVTALACQSGLPDSTAANQVYTLQAAAPTMIVAGLTPPDGRALMYSSAAQSGNGYMPTISDSTTGSNIWITTGTTPPSCITGTQVGNPHTFSGPTPADGLYNNTTYQAIGCKTNYAPSDVVSFPYTVTLNNPVPQSAAAPHYKTFTASVDDSANLGSSDALCATNDGTMPTCGTGASCSHGDASTMLAVSTTGTIINVVACAPSGLNSSQAVPSGAYVLMLAPPYLDKPGVDTSGNPLTSFTFAPGTTSGMENIAETTPVTGPQGYDYACISKTATADCSCTSTSANYVLPAAFTGAVTANAGDTWSVIGCANSTTGFANSVATTVSYQAAGHATPPSISPSNPGPFSTQQTITLTNMDGNASYLCWTTDGSTPTANGSCAATGTTTCTTTTIGTTSGSNTYAVTTKVEANNTTVKAIACNSTELPPSAPTSQLLTFQLAEPDVSATTTGDLNGGGQVGGSQTITFSTASDFDSETLNWSDDGSAVNCTTAQHTGAATPHSYVVPTGATSVSLHIIACGTAQLASAPRIVTLTVGAATPVITTDQIASGPNASKPQSPWENAFTLTITSPTSGATICYRSGNGAQGTPTCTSNGTTATCDANSTPAANGVSFMVTTSGTSVTAVACTPTLTTTGSATASFTLNVTPVALSSTTAASCAVTYTLAPAASTIGGPTATATLCWSTTASFTYCGPQNASTPAGVTCGAYTSTDLPAISTSGTVYYTTCKTGFNGNTGSSFPLPVTPNATAGITVDGTLQSNEWPVGDTLAGSAGVTGYFAHDASTLYFAANGYTAAAGTDVVIYLGNGTGGTTTGPAAFGGALLPFSATWAFGWPTSNGPLVEYAWTSTNGWQTTTFSPDVTVGFSTGNTVEFSLPISSLGSPTTVTTSGAIVTGVNTTTISTTAVWPTGGPPSYVADLLSSCQTPVQQEH
jgi:hypothetical protein